MNHTSFADLEAENTITPDDLLFTLKDYAVDTRAAINPHAVIAIIRRLTPPLSRAQRLEVIRLCRDAEKWNTDKHSRTAKEYRQVAEFLS